MEANSARSDGSASLSTIAEAPESAASASASSAVSIGEAGWAMQPIAAAAKMAITASTSLAARIITRSPFLSPFATRPPATRRTFESSSA